MRNLEIILVNSLYIVFARETNHRLGIRVVIFFLCNSTVMSLEWCVKEHAEVVDGKHSIIYEISSLI